VPFVCRNIFHFTYTWLTTLALVCAGPVIRGTVVKTVQPRTSEDLRLVSLYLEPSSEWLDKPFADAPVRSGQTTIQDGHRMSSDCAVVSESTLAPEIPVSKEANWRKQKAAGNVGDHDGRSDCASVLSGSTLTPESNDEKWRKQKIAEGGPKGLRYTKSSKKATGKHYVV
jgi:hypothetical protein